MFRSFAVAALALSAAACNSALPTAPSTLVEAPANKTVDTRPTSQVPLWMVPEGLTLEHNPSTPGVSVCRTQLRPYVGANGLTSWEVDFYTVLAPEECPAEPIE